MIKIISAGKKIFFLKLNSTSEGMRWEEYVTDCTLLWNDFLMHLRIRSRLNVIYVTSTSYSKNILYLYHMVFSACETAYFPSHKARFEKSNMKNWVIFQQTQVWKIHTQAFLWLAFGLAGRKSFHILKCTYEESVSVSACSSIQKWDTEIVLTE